MAGDRLKSQKPAKQDLTMSIELEDVLEAADVVTPPLPPPPKALASSEFLGFKVPKVVHVSSSDIISESTDAPEDESTLVPIYHRRAWRVGAVAAIGLIPVTVMAIVIGVRDDPTSTPLKHAVAPARGVVTVKTEPLAEADVQRDVRVTWRNAPTDSEEQPASPPRDEPATAAGAKEMARETSKTPAREPASVEAHRGKARQLEINTHLKAARQALKSKQWKMARRQAVLALMLDRDNSTARSITRQSLTLERQARAEKARQNRVKRHLKNARRAMKNRWWTSARQQAALALKLDPQNRAAQSITHRSEELEHQARKEKARQKKINYHLKNARRAMKSRQWKSARQQAALALRLEPKNRSAKSIIHWSEAGERRDQAKKARLKHHLKSAYLAMKSKRWTTAKRKATLALRIDPKNRSARSIKHKAAALERREQARRARVKRHLKSARRAMKSKRWTTAKRKAALALRIDPKNRFARSIKRKAENRLRRQSRRRTG